MEREERCGTCRFRERLLLLDESGRWDPEFKRGEPGWPDGGVTEAEYEIRYGDDASGECHRYPPRGPGQFPLVRLDDWCGEWQARKPLPVVEPPA